jgi:hypothetical protein
MLVFQPYVIPCWKGALTLPLEAFIQLLMLQLTGMAWLLQRPSGTSGTSGYHCQTIPQAIYHSVHQKVTLK